MPLKVSLLEEYLDCSKVRELYLHLEHAYEALGLNTCAVTRVAPRSLFDFRRLPAYYPRAILNRNLTCHKEQHACAIPPAG